MLTDAQEVALVARYSSGDGDVRAIASDFSVVVQTVYNILRRRGVVLRGERLRGDSDLLIDAAVRGDTLTRAAKILSISQSTATRRVRERRASGEEVLIRKGRPPRSARILGTGDDLDIARLRLTAFPYPKMLLDEEIALDFKRLRKIDLFLDGDVIRPQSLVGLKICNPFFPNRYDAKSKGSVSATEAWASDSEIRKAVRFQLNHGDPITPKRVLRAITLRCRTPTIFRPAVARFVYERYCRPGGSTWDPCIGYGGRLLGAASVGVRYVGTDVDERTIEGNTRLASAIGADASLHLNAAEIFDPPRVDLVFTSPPYFDRERYSDAEDQSWKKYGTRLDAWVEGFLRPVIERAFRVLDAGQHLVLNVADLKEKGAVIPIVARTVSVACESGFNHVETLQMPLASMNRKSPVEPVLVFQKGI